MTFEKIQDTILPENSIRRQHAIPLDVRLFAGTEQLKFTGQRGRGRSNVPTLADIYYTLILEGIALLEKGIKPIFTEIGHPDGCSFTRIKFDVGIDAKLREIKALGDSGEYIILPFKQISLISVAVTLMLLAIADRKGTTLEGALYPAK